MIEIDSHESRTDSTRPCDANADTTKEQLVIRPSKMTAASSITTSGATTSLLGTITESQNEEESSCCSGIEITRLIREQEEDESSSLRQVQSTARLLPHHKHKKIRRAHRRVASTHVLNMCGIKMYMVYAREITRESKRRAAFFSRIFFASRRHLD